jgi:hypothetical protein
MFNCIEYIIIFKIQIVGIDGLVMHADIMLQCIYHYI